MARRRSDTFTAFARGVHKLGRVPNLVDLQEDRIKCTPRLPAAGERCREGEAVDVEDHEPVARHRHEADAESGEAG